MKILISLLSASGLAFTVSAAHRTIRAPKSNNDNLDEEFDEAKKNITAEYGKKFMESAVFDDYQALEKKIDSYKYLNDSTIFSTVEKMGNVASNVYLDYSYAIWKEAAKDTPVDLEYRFGLFLFGNQL